MGPSLIIYGIIQHLETLTYTFFSDMMCIGGVNMRTNIVLDDDLVDKAMKCTGIRTKKELVNFALRELLKRRERKSILRLEGKLCWEGDLEDMRKDRFCDIS